MKDLFLTISTLINLTVILASCRSSFPPIDVSFWAGDSSAGGVTRKQDGKTIACHSPEFDAYACMSYEDIKKVAQALERCKEWG